MTFHESQIQHRGFDVFVSQPFLHGPNTLVLQNQAELYNLLFRAVAQTLREIARNPEHLGAEIGFFGILHTWGQNLRFIRTSTASFLVAVCPRIATRGFTRDTRSSYL